MNTHSLLKRQLKKTFGETNEFSEEMEQFFKLVNRAYFDFEEDRNLLERSLELTSRELVERHDGLKKENKKLTEAQEQLIEKEKKLKASVEEKVILLQEIHHRVKNNLAAISGLLFLQAEMGKNEEVRVKLNEAQSRIHSMAMIHEMLYESESFSSIQIGAYIKQLVQAIIDSFKSQELEVKLRVNSQNLRIDIESAVPIALLINEVVINSLKYAFPDRLKGEIKINFHCISKDQMELRISDDGVGIPEDIELGSPTSLGIKLIKTFASQLKGAIELHRNNGTEIVVRFPMSAIVKRKNMELIEKLVT